MALAAVRSRASRWRPPRKLAQAGKPASRALHQLDDPPAPVREQACGRAGEPEPQLSQQIGFAASPCSGMNQSSRKLID